MKIALNILQDGFGVRPFAVQVSLVNFNAAAVFFIGTGQEQLQHAAGIGIGIGLFPQIFANQRLQIEMDIFVLRIRVDYTVVSGFFFGNRFPEEIRQNRIRREKILKQNLKGCALEHKYKRKGSGGGEDPVTEPGSCDEEISRTQSQCPIIKGVAAKALIDIGKGIHIIDGLIIVYIVVKLLITEQISFI